MRTLTTIIVLVGLLAGPAFAADPQASRSTFVKLMDVQELWEEDRYPEAIEVLEDLVASTRDKPYDFAIANQYLAHTAVMMGEQERARPALEAALATSGLPEQLVGELKMFYAQIVIGDEEFGLAKQLFDDWLAITEEPPTPAQLFSIGYANYMSGHLPEARDFVSRAIDESPKPPDNWLRLYYQVLFESEDYTAAERIAVDLVNREPANEQFWRLLASHYMRLENYRQALATAEVASMTGAMQTESDLRRIASLYSQVYVPERAARRLARWIDEGKVEADAETWRQLGDLWMLARERENAKAALWKSTEIEPEAKTLEFLASIHFEDAEWERSYTAFERALDMTDPEDEDLHRLEMLTGLTAMRAGNESAARRFLARAERSEDLRGQVRSILRELDAR
jgi:tetratricopeptide (TPR) repeat protein